MLNGYWGFLWLMTVVRVVWCLSISVFRTEVALWRLLVIQTFGVRCIGPWGLSGIDTVGRVHLTGQAVRSR